MFKIVMLLLTSVSFLVSGNFTLKSSDLKGWLSKKQVYNRFGCNGKNISPQLSWYNAPKETKSFAITMYDPDAPTGSGWWHWLVVNIPANINSLKSNASKIDMPKGALETVNDYGEVGFGGACPPKGDKPHRYIVTVYALNVPRLGLKKTTKAPIVEYMINQHTISKASLISYYRR